MVETRRSNRIKLNADSKGVRDDQENTVTRPKDDAPPRKRQRWESVADQKSKSASGASKSKSQPSTSKIKNANATSKTGRGKGKGQKAARRDSGDYFSDLPVELHLEIASYLIIEDLLRLPRVSHRLHSILFSKNSRHIWVECLSGSGHGVPPCPSELIEPRYANLLFESSCDTCGKSDKFVQAYYELRIKMCSMCLEMHAQPGSVVVKSFDKSLLEIADIYKLVPHLYDRGRYLSSNGLDFLQQMQFDKTVLTNALERYKATAEISTEALEEFVREQQQRRIDFVKQCILVREWVSKRLLAQANERSRLREERKKSVEEAVKEKGYTDREISSNNHELQWKYKDLLEKEKYNTKDHNRLVSVIVSAIETDRTKKIEEERDFRTQKRKSELALAYKEYLQSLYTTHGERETFPTILVVLSIPQVVEMMQFEDYSRPVTYDLFLEHLPAFEQVLFECRVNLINRHTSIFSKWLYQTQSSLVTDTNVPEQNRVHLCTSFFGAYEYAGPYYISPVSSLCPAIIGERSVPPWFEQDVDEDEGMYGFRHVGYRNESLTFETQDDAFRQVKFTIMTAEIACMLLQDLEMPQSTMMTKMLAFGKRFVCLKCDEEVRCGMSWIGIIQHYLREKAWFKDAKAAKWRNFSIKVIDDHHQKEGRPGSFVKILTKDELTSLYSNIARQEANATFEKCKCRLCETLGLRAHSMTRRHVEIHIMKKHGKFTIGKQDIRVPPPPEELSLD